MGYDDYQIGNVTILRVYYVEGLGYNLFSVGQFCDSNLEVAFRQHTCFIRNLEGIAIVQHSKLNANSKFICVKCNGCMLSDNHDLCVLNVINDVNAHSKSRSVKKTSKRKVCKPTGKVFTKIGYTWRPTGWTFTIVGNACPLSRITTTVEVSLRKTTTLETDTPKPVATLVIQNPKSK
nr:integrase, catalytic region, zinc finger, CCHC-type, peptidase aspartic, catalytic [Tanacetum cinerariifolium]